MRVRNRNMLIIFLVNLVFLIYYYVFIRYTVKWNQSEYSYVDYLKEVETHKAIVKRYFEKRNSWTTSNLGTILFKNINPEEFFRHSFVNKTFVVLFWKHWNWQRNRHVYNFGSSQSSGPKEILKYCSVKNCIFSGDDKYMDTADAVIIHMQKKQIPRVKKRNPSQRWIFLSDESPINTFSLGQGSNLTWNDMGDVFNWTMTYRSNSDIPVPYGRTIALSHPVVVASTDLNAALKTLVPYWEVKQLSSRTMVITSNCMKMRMDFVHGLQNYIDVDVFGGCSDIKENKNKCPGHFRTDCMLPASYLFYLVLENSKCRQYITEKVFHNAYSKGAIPVIMGPSLEDCETLLPPNSFLHVENYKNIQSLADHMKDISKNLDKIYHFHEWRRYFAVVNEHGYFKTRSYHLCRVCEALNFNDEAMKSYSEKELSMYFDKNQLCDLEYGSKLSIVSNLFFRNVFLFPLSI